MSNRSYLVISLNFGIIVIIISDHWLGISNSVAQKKIINNKRDKQRTRTTVPPCILHKLPNYLLVIRLHTPYFIHSILNKSANVIGFHLYMYYASVLVVIRAHEGESKRPYTTQGSARDSTRFTRISAGGARRRGAPPASRAMDVVSSLDPRHCRSSFLELFC